MDSGAYAGSERVSELGYSFSFERERLAGFLDPPWSVVGESGLARLDEFLGVPEFGVRVGSLGRESLRAYAYAEGFVPSCLSWVADFGLLLSSGDRVYDVGSGLGHVLLPLAARYDACEFVGLELRRERVAFAEAAAERFGLDNVSFVAGDALARDVSDANWFFLYHPFHGPVLDEMFARMAAVPECQVYFVSPFDNPDSLFDGFGEAQQYMVPGGSSRDVVRVLRSLSRKVPDEYRD